MNIILKTKLVIIFSHKNEYSESAEFPLSPQANHASNTAAYFFLCAVSKNNFDDSLLCPDPNRTFQTI